jgi:hypothetical protein
MRVPLRPRSPEDGGTEPLRSRGALRDEGRVCEDPLVPGLRRLRIEDGAERSERQRLAGETLPTNSLVLAALTSHL